MSLYYCIPLEKCYHFGNYSVTFTLKTNNNQGLELWHNLNKTHCQLVIFNFNYNNQRPF
jgi:hypothetical protein